MSQLVALAISYFIVQGALLVQCVSGKDINSKPNIVILLADDVSRFVSLCVARDSAMATLRCLKNCPL